MFRLMASKQQIKRRLPPLRSLVLISLLALLTLFVLSMLPGGHATAAVWTDKADYEPSETVTIFGSRFNPNAHIDLTIIRPNGVVDTGYTTSDALGEFVYYYVLDGVTGTYTVTATEGANSTTTTFRDGTITPKIWGYTLEPTEGWIYGDVKGYYECQWVPYKIEITSTTAGSYELTVVVHHDYFDGTWPGLDDVNNWKMWRNGVEETPTISKPVVDGWYSGIQQLEYNWRFTINEGDNCTLIAETHIAIGAHNWPGSKVHTRIRAITSVHYTPICVGHRDIPIVVGAFADLTVSKEATAYWNQTYSWTITKAVESDTFNLFEGEEAIIEYTVSVEKEIASNEYWVEGTITIDNPNDYDIEATVLDEVLSDTTVIGFQDLGTVTLTANTSTYLDYSVSLPAAGDYNNKVTVAITDPVEKTYEMLVPFSTPAEPTAKIHDSAIVSDSEDLGGLTLVSYTGPTWPQMISDTTPFTFTKTVKSDLVGTYALNNTAEVRDMVTDEWLDSDDESLNVVVHALSVTKTANVEWVQTFAWTITKTANSTVLNLFKGEEGAISYTINVTRSVVSDSYRVYGTITILNPNPDSDAAVTITDDLLGISGETCTVTPSSVTVPKGGSATVNYECTGFSPTVGTGYTNEATVTLTLTSKTYIGSATFTFTAPTQLVDDQATIDDDQIASPELTLTCTGDCTWPQTISDSTTYSYVKTVSSDTAGTYHINDTATFVTDDTGSTDSAKVSVDVFVSASPPPGDILVDKVEEVLSGPDPPQIGRTTIYELTITVENIGGSPILDVVIRDVIPPDVEFEGLGTPTSGTASYSPLDRIIIWEIESMDPDQVETLPFRVRLTPQAPGSYWLNEDPLVGNATDSATGDPVSDTGPGIPREVKGKPTPVGGTIMPVNKLALVGPWAGLIVLIALTAAALGVKRTGSSPYLSSCSRSLRRGPSKKP